MSLYWYGFEGLDNIEVVNEPFLAFFGAQSSPKSWRYKDSSFLIMKSKYSSYPIPFFTYPSQTSKILSDLTLPSYL